MNGDAAALCVYNCTSDFALTAGAVVVVTDAVVDRIVVQQCDVVADQQSVYRSIRVPSPDQLIVNGRRVSGGKTALSKLESNTKI